MAFLFCQMIFLVVFWLFSDDSYAVNSVSQGIFTTGLVSLLASVFPRPTY